MRNIFKKTTVLKFLIFSLLLGLFLPLHFSSADTPPNCNSGHYISLDGQSCVPDCNGSHVSSDNIRCVAQCTTPPEIEKIADDGTAYCIDMTYHLLAPLPSCKPSDPGCVCSPSGDSCTLTYFDPGSSTGSSSDTLGQYLNMMIKIFIGICAVLAVIMIVIGGMKYMTDELISNKEEGKKRIMGAIFGLLLALGAWVLLNQINPTILKSNVDIPTAVVAVAGIQPDANYTPTNPTSVPTGPVPNCPGGVTKGTSGIVACSSISAEIDKMVADAAHATPPITISGGGFRTQADQIQLRTKNCGGAANVYNASATCSPPTAVPGHSLHEAGLAFDLTCNGAQTSSSSDCFKWLQKNASNYGLKNLPGEAWHWSTTGQ